MGWLRLWFSLDGKVTRKQYLLSGLGLMALKYLLDAAVIYFGEQRVFTPLEFISPLFTTKKELLASSPSVLLAMMTLWALVFLWIGVSMTMRRAVDAGWSAWTGFLFVLPIINFVIIAVLVFAPSRATQPWEFSKVPPGQVDKVKSAVIGVGAGIGVAALMVGASIFLLKEYGLALFFATPSIMGGIAAYTYNSKQPRTTRSTIGVAIASVALGSGSLLMFAFEGILCLAMAFPIVAGAAVIGALFGRAIAVRGGGPGGLLLLILALPFTTAMSSAVSIEQNLREVISAVEVDAPPEAVWKNVVAFADLPPPSELIFRLGIAYPVRAKIYGEGPGAVRHCEFSTGPFVEPITAWDAPNRLSFDVTSQPLPMHEWSPYQGVHPPHLDGYLRSKRGEFRLIALPGGRTRLEGSTWYALELQPTDYWALWSDALIHGIHRRVLEHIKSETEKR